MNVLSPTPTPRAGIWSWWNAVLSSKRLVGLYPVTYPLLPACPMILAGIGLLGNASACAVFAPCTPPAGSEVQLFSQQRLLELQGEMGRGCPSRSVGLGEVGSVPPPQSAEHTGWSPIQSMLADTLMCEAVV